MGANSGTTTSVSRVSLGIEIAGKGTAQCELIRHLAPLTSKAILSGLPYQGLAHRYGDSFVYFETGLVLGAEKQKTSFKRGDIGFLVSNGSIAVFLKDSSSQPMNPLGKIISNLELIESSGAGDVMLIKKLTA